jgi:hypothetical protein
MTRPRRAESPRSLNRSTSGAKKARSPAAMCAQGRDEDEDEALAVDPARKGPRAAP